MTNHNAPRTPPSGYQIEAFEFLPDAIEFLSDDGSKWRVRPSLDGVLNGGSWADLFAAFGTEVDRIVGRVVCRLKDGTPAMGALYLDAEGHLHWTSPVPVGGPQ